LAILLLSLHLAFAPHAHSQSLRDVRRVLILNQLSPFASPGLRLMDEAIIAALQKSPYQIELYTENLETSLFPDEHSQQKFRTWYIEKYHDRKPDVIFTAGPDAIKFMVESHKDYFPGIPVVFCGSTQEMLDNEDLGRDFTGVWAVAQPEETLQAALRLLPRTKHVVVTGGVGAYDRDLQAIVKASFRKYESTLDFTYLTEEAMPTLLEKLKELPRNTIIYHTSMMRDTAGTPFIDASQSMPMIAGAANAPIFVVDDVDLGTGAVGGNLLSFEKQGRLAAEIALRVLGGAKAQDIPIVRSPNVYTFDSRAMKRWGLKESSLPLGSILLNRQPTYWEAYKNYILGGLALIVLEAILILALLWQRTTRRKVEAELATTHDHLRLAVEAGKSVCWDWDVKTGRDRWFGDLPTMFGIPLHDYSGNVEDFRRHIHPEDRAVVWQAVTAARKTREPYFAEFRVIRTDGALRWVRARGRFYYGPDGEAQRMVGMSVDVTDSKRAEEALMKLSGRLLDAQEEERKRIAREIHDDYNQRLAMLAIDLENLAADKNATTGIRDQLEEFWARVSELGADLHALSHSLHSSTLESLGLVAGVKAFSKEFADQQGMQVNFSHENVPLDIPGDVALCLFRVVQEGLRNIKRHSSANRAEVRIEGTGDGLHLTISDKGRGFAPGTNSSHGIGIHSMEERLRILGGKFEIRSRPMEGTRIDAWLPFKVPVPVPRAS
jgi:signal transduction histidine kinase/ABC-type uncharacterized transport system substrate-binding protein